MAEYVERKDVFNKKVEVPLFGKMVEMVAVSEVQRIPAADVRPVVTCGKCKYGQYTGVGWFCDKHSGHADVFGEDASYHEYHGEYWFCADGEKRN